MNQADYIYSEKRPWGEFFIIQETISYKIKRIEVNPGQRLSYQYHNKRSEVWIIIQGEGTVLLNDNKINNLENSCNKMNEHINFVEETYTTLKTPLSFIKKNITLKKRCILNMVNLIFYQII